MAEAVRSTAGSDTMAENIAGRAIAYVPPAMLPWRAL